MPMVVSNPKARPVPARRFTDKPDLDPSAVWSLPNGHVALKENRTLFSSTVVDVDDSFGDRLLVSGANNRKLGDKIIKGKFKGYALYGLSLEERATCPSDCSALAYCYGNGMQMARRHRITDLDLFFAFLEDDVREVLFEQDGLMVRLHVLGDFPSVEYVEWWGVLLGRHPGLACYGYTHRRPKSRGGDKIGDAIDALKGKFPDRFRIRWSSDVPLPDSAIVIDEVPAGPKFGKAIVCPAQTDASSCCAACGLCWEGASRRETIAFIKHGERDMAAAAIAEAEKHPSKNGSRKIVSIALPSGVKPNSVVNGVPVMRTVKPQDILVESDYQRDLSGKSIALIRKIVAGWDWAKFKPPVCAETKDGLFVIDGQHTAIAAATHPDIQEIPVVIVDASYLEKRAAAFVSHNRDRLVMTPAQVFYGDLAAGDKTAKSIMECVVKSGASVPRLPVAKGYWKPGQIAAVGELTAALKGGGASVLERVLRISVLAKQAPITKTILRGLRCILTENEYRHIRELADEKIASAIIAIDDLEKECARIAADADISRFRACADLISGECADLIAGEPA